MQIHPGGLPRCPVGFDGALVLRDECDLGIQRLARHGILRRQALVAGQIDLSAFQHGFVARELPLGLRQGGFIRPRIDLREQIALLDLVAFLEVDLHQIAADLGSDGHGRQRSHRAEGVEVDPDIALADNLRNNGHRRGIPATSALLRRNPLSAPPDDAGDNQQGQDGCQNKPSAGRRLGNL
ncbi:hypothetical protein GALL_443110 [mine drainage metagenome]|uniref:Uncharacterized protein n=1 Tax=mine drainage metagenome TaxID=410659 RepID=A0A1J5PR25_9ZZZZ